MKKLLFALTIIGTFFSSCSKDAIAEKLIDALTDEEAIVGVWQLTDYNVDSEAAGTNINLGEDILDALTAEDCPLVTFEFKEDAILEIQNAVNYLEIDFGVTGLEVGCPAEKDTETTVYTYVDGVITFKNESGEDVNVAATIDGDTMTVDAEDLDLNNFNTAGELIFTKQ